MVRLLAGAVAAAAPVVPPRPAAGIDLKALHPDAAFIRILGVNYVHIRLDDEGDLYLTQDGAHLSRQLMPENWYHEDWFARHRRRLEGTGTVYRLPTRPVDATPAQVDLVIKWSRVGQDVPLNTFTVDRQIDAEFNSPFEEFALLEELRASVGPAGVRRRILTQKPLAIYVPPERMQLWQTGRSRDKVMARVARHAGVHIDMLRSYILMYQWIDGPNAVDALRACSVSREREQQELRELTERVDRDMRAHGFLVADHKPAHVIVRVKDGRLRRRRDGSVVYGVVDYELLARTAQREDEFQAERRRDYLRRQRDRFLPTEHFTYPSNRRRMRLLGVDYVHGRCASTGGTVWVVGNDPDLFRYFVPERWHRRLVRLSDTGQTYYNQTKDRVHVVWKVSRVGELPPGDLVDPVVNRQLRHGYNSPFEEFSMALELRRAGVPTAYPRAIYMSASVSSAEGRVLDERRFEAMRDARSPEGVPVLPTDHDFVTIWGYWRGLEDADAISDAHLWTPIDAGQAWANGLVDDDGLADLLNRHRDRMAAAGFIDLNPKPDHVLLSYIPAGPLKLDAEGLPESRQCNFELVARV